VGRTGTVSAAAIDCGEESSTLPCTIDTLAQIGEAIGTICATVLALVVVLFGRRIEQYRFGPRLKLELPPKERGHLTPRGSGKHGRYYHLKVINTGHTAAQRVRVRVASIHRRQADGSWAREKDYVIPVQRHWAYSLTWPPNDRFQASLPTIWRDDEYYCDIAYLDEPDRDRQSAKDEWRVKVPSYEDPYDFPGDVSKGDSVRLSLVASADNCKSEPLVVEISWDGVWDADADSVLQHLKISQHKAADC
jgi:hypothetical protein